MPPFPPKNDVRGCRGVTYGPWEGDPGPKEKQPRGYVAARRTEALGCVLSGAEARSSCRLSASGNRLLRVRRRTHHARDAATSQRAVGHRARDVSRAGRAGGAGRLRGIGLFDSVGLCAVTVLAK